MPLAPLYPHIRSTLGTIAGNVGLRPELLADVTLDAYRPSDGVEHERALQEAFKFFRAADNRKYSSRTKMRLLDAANEAERARLNGKEVSNALPSVLVASKPYSYDEDTEVKTGGPIATAVVWPSDGKLLLAVRAPHRRKRWGSFLITVLEAMDQFAFRAWVHQSNSEAQAFLLSRGFSPEGYNNAGGVCFSRDTVLEDGTEDSLYEDEIPSDPRPTTATAPLPEPVWFPQRIENPSPAEVYGADCYDEEDSF